MEAIGVFTRARKFKHPPPPPCAATVTLHGAPGYQVDDGKAWKGENMIAMVLGIQSVMTITEASPHLYTAYWSCDMLS